MESDAEDDTAARLRFDGGEAARPLDDRFGTDQLIELAGLNRSPHAVQRMFAQKLQDPHEPPCAGLGAVDVVPARHGASAKQAGSFQSRNTGAWSSAPGLRPRVAR